MGIARRKYQNDLWKEFSDKIMRRDLYKCTKCKRGYEDLVVLQVHHREYHQGYEPWEYSMSDCYTLCSGCHAREHKLLEEVSGWTLIGIYDLGDLSGICERDGCGRDIRYEHEIYHPKYGYRNVGSGCVEFMTKEDEETSADVLKLYKQTSEFLNGNVWHKDETKKGISFIATKYNHSFVRIYGNSEFYSVQILEKVKGVRWFNYMRPTKLYGLSMKEVKELSFLILKGVLTECEVEREMIRNVYLNTKKAMKAM